MNSSYPLTSSTMRKGTCDVCGQSCKEGGGAVMSCHVQGCESKASMTLNLSISRALIITLALTLSTTYGSLELLLAAIHFVFNTPYSSRLCLNAFCNNRQAHAMCARKAWDFDFWRPSARCRAKNHPRHHIPWRREASS